MVIALKRPETTVDLCLDGAKYAAHKEAVARLDRLQKERLVDDRLNDPVHELAAQIRELEAAMQAETVTFTLRGFPRADWERLVLDHPARPDSDLDKAYGFNLAALADAALPKSVLKVTQAGEDVPFDPETEWSALADQMTNAQYEDFQVGLLQVNRGREGLPFSHSASALMRDSDKS